MPIKYLLIVLISLLAFAACENSPEKETKKTEQTDFVVTIDTNMTIGEFAKANQIGEPYLRTKLGMPTRAGGQLPLHQLKKNYRFTYKSLEDIVYKAKNR